MLVSAPNLSVQDFRRTSRITYQIFILNLIWKNVLWHHVLMSFHIYSLSHYPVIIGTWLQYFHGSNTTFDKRGLLTKQNFPTQTNTDIAGGLYLGQAQLRYLAFVCFYRYTNNAIFSLIHCNILTCSIINQGELTIFISTILILIAE